MEIYTLNPLFGLDVVVDKFETFIWTERYSAHGEFVLTAEASPAVLDVLTEKTFVGVNDSEEVGIVETVLIKDGMVEIKGPLLTGFLKQRIVRSTRDHDVKYWEITGSPGYIASEIVDEMCCASGLSSGVGGPYPTVPGSTLEVIDYLSVATPPTGDTYTLGVPFGTVYDAVKTVCETFGLGFVMKPFNITPTSYELTFNVYEGRNLTRDQSTYPVVSFSSALDTLSDPTELRSIAGYKNVAYAYSPSLTPASLGGYEVGVAYADFGETDTNFDRRSMMVLCEDITTDEIGASLPLLKYILDQRAADALANNNYVRMLDGKLVPQTGLVYGEDYSLGDIIELRSSSGLDQKARITEFIHSKDGNGEQHYPTLSVITE